MNCPLVLKHKLKSFKRLSMSLFRSQSCSIAPELGPRLLRNHAQPFATSLAPASGPLCRPGGIAYRASSPPCHPSPWYIAQNYCFLFGCCRNNVKRLKYGGVWSVFSSRYSFFSHFIFIVNIYLSTII